MLALFGQLKQKLAELNNLAKKADNATGKIHPLEWLDVLGSTLADSLTGCQMEPCLSKVGALNGQTDVPSSVFADLGWSAPPAIPDGPPTELEARAVFAQREES